MFLLGIYYFAVVFPWYLDAFFNLEGFKTFDILYLKRR